MDGDCRRRGDIQRRRGRSPRGMRTQRSSFLWCARRMTVIYNFAERTWTRIFVTVDNIVRSPHVGANAVFLCQNFKRPTPITLERILHLSTRRRTSRRQSRPHRRRVQKRPLLLWKKARTAATPAECRTALKRLRRGAYRGSCRTRMCIGRPSRCPRSST